MEWSLRIFLIRIPKILIPNELCGLGQKWSSQNLEPQGLTGKIFWNKDLAPRRNTVRESAWTNRLGERSRMEQAWAFWNSQSRSSVTGSAIFIVDGCGLPVMGQKYGCPILPALFAGGWALARTGIGKECALSQSVIRIKGACTSSPSVAIGRMKLPDFAEAKELFSASWNVLAAVWPAPMPEHVHLLFRKAHPPAQTAGRVGQPVRGFSMAGKPPDLHFLYKSARDVNLITKPPGRRQTGQIFQQDQACFRNPSALGLDNVRRGKCHSYDL